MFKNKVQEEMYTYATIISGGIDSMERRCKVLKRNPTNRFNIKQLSDIEHNAEFVLKEVKEAKEFLVKYKGE